MIEKGGTGIGLGGGFSRGFPRGVRCAFADVRKRSMKERKRRRPCERTPRVEEEDEEKEQEQERAPKSFLPRSPPRDVPADTADSRGARGGEKSGKARGWRERGEIERGRGRKDVRQGAYKGARRIEAASRRVLPRRARSDAARLSRRGKREGGGGGRGCHGGGGKDAHSFLESRGSLLILKGFSFRRAGDSNGLRLTPTRTLGDASGVGATYR